MNKSTLGAMLAIVVLIGCDQRFASATSDTADTVYINGKIYTVDETQPWVEAVAVKGGKFLKVGSNDEIHALAGDGTTSVDLEGSMVMPGLVDAHVHPLGVANSWANLRLTNPTDRDAILASVFQLNGAEVADNIGRYVGCRIVHFVKKLLGHRRPGYTRCLGQFSRCPFVIRHIEEQHHDRETALR